MRAAYSRTIHGMAQRASLVTGETRARPERRPIGMLLVLGAVTWVASTCLFIYQEPDSGDATTEALAATYERALATRDSDALTRVVHEAPEEAEELQRLLAPAQCGGGTVTVRATQDSEESARLLLMNGSGSACAALPAARHAGRWYIDLWQEPFRGAQ
jgi:hypothetical protein